MDVNSRPRVVVAEGCRRRAVFQASRICGGCQGGCGLLTQPLGAVVASLGGITPRCFVWLGSQSVLGRWRARSLLLQQV